MKQKTKWKILKLVYLKRKRPLDWAIGNSILGKKELTKSTKLRVANAMVLPTLHDLWL